MAFSIKCSLLEARPGWFKIELFKDAAEKSCDKFELAVQVRNGPLGLLCKSWQERYGFNNYEREGFLVKMKAFRDKHESSSSLGSA